ncbi:MAG: hypothetical protein JSR55_14135 [Proteobacteria bacterium]|nr:hypothetical protein [Pseudomonadota bacterium]
MRKTTIALMAGALALAGTAAFAASDNVHHMTVRLADGSVASIEYTGNVAPKVSIREGQPMSLADFAPMPGFAPFAGFQQIDAMMNAQMRQMQQQIDAMMAMPLGANAPIEAAFGKTGGTFCAQSVRITTDANGKQNIERKTAGNCGGAAISAPAQQPKAHRDTI